MLFIDEVPANVSACYETLKVFKLESRLAFCLEVNFVVLDVLSSCILDSFLHLCVGLIVKPFAMFSAFVCAASFGHSLIVINY